MQRFILGVVLAAMTVGVLGLSTESTRAAAVIDEGGYYNVLAYGQWVFEHDVHGAHHCCSGGTQAEAVSLVATLGDGAALSEDVQYPWTQGPYIVQFVFVDGVRWEQWYDPSSGAGWWEAYPGPGIDPYCFGCG